MKFNRNIIFLGTAMFLLLVALWAGWLRIGWNWPAWQPRLILAHGAVMVSGFLGTLISLERAVALRKAWAYAAPFFAGAGGLLLAFGAPAVLAAGFFTLGSLFLGIVFVHILRQRPALPGLIMSLGALVWLGGNAIWLAGRPIYSLVFWWMAFLVLTVVGERLELSRILRPGQRAEIFFLVLSLTSIIGLVVSLFSAPAGMRILFASFLAQAAWLLHYDIARRTVRQVGLPRFIAICLLSGFAWLAFGGILGLVIGPVYAGVQYDAILHSIFLGFIISMIFGHSPIILPAILNRGLAFKPRLYLPLILLHLSLLLRITGDLLVNWEVRRWGGLLNGIAILIFFGLVLITKNRKQNA